MKSNYIFTAFLFFLSISILAQQKEVDSVNYLFETIPKAFENKDYKNAFELSEKAIATYKNNDSLSGLANLTLGKIKFGQRQYGPSVQHFNTAVEHFTKNGEYKLVYEAYINLGTLYRLKRDYATARNYFSKAIAVIKKKYSNNHENLIEAYKGILRVEKEDQNFEAALEYADKGLQVIKKLDNQAHEAIFLTYKGDILQLQRNFDPAIENYLKAIQIKEKLYGIYHRGNLVTYNNLAGAYSQLYYLDKAIEYQERVIDINQKLPQNQQVSYTSAYGNLAVYYTEFGTPEKSIQYHKKALVYLKQELGEDHFLYPMLYKNFGDTYYDLKEYENAQKYYKASLDYYLDNSKVADINATEGYTNLALVAKNTRNFDAAQKYLQASLKIYPKNHYLIIPCQLELTNVFIAQEKYELANAYLDSIAQKLPQKELSELNFDQLKDRKEYINAKINYYKNASSNNTDSLIYFYKKAIALDDYTIKEYTTAPTKDFQLSKAFPLYESYVKHIVENNQKAEAESVLEILEKTKARRLTESFNKEKSSIATKIPDSLATLEQQLNVDVVFYEEQKSLEINDPQPQSDSLIGVYNTKLFKLKRQQNQLQETFKSTYPDYYDLIYNRKVINIQQVQKYLGEKQSLIEYFVGENDIFIFVITKNTFEYTSVPKDFPLKEWVTQLREGIYNYWALPNSADEQLKKYNTLYKEVAFKLYQKLVQPIENVLTKEVIIIPDGELNFIPFDALLTEESSTNDLIKTLPYLLKKHQISYNYSATLFGQLKEKSNSKASNDVLAFAPKFGDEKMETIAMRRSGLGVLKYNIEEVEAINNLFNTSIFKNDLATKANFISNAKDHKIIHLSTHAKSNDIQGDDSFIAFSKSHDSLENNQLYVRELYNLNLDADMVVLSACETGIGELKKGEGVISLARAFTYAGARSTITSLWNVNDAQTTKLMTLFYNNLKEGMTKDEALHKAKLHYIESEDLAAPYFWAAFIPAGNMDAIQFSENTQKYYIIGGCLAFLLLGFGIYQKRKKAA
ncbi:CHAT domain-containing protein [uncultured Kordia sp.]|uniref:CHAT domain-containing protein n=1 Tax=uncultured Kordia sp. TaxID=507699 RepID=UPI0026171768|nr:CHAT domain-containing protein [uncultured Kordia sp.]